MEFERTLALDRESDTIIEVLDFEFSILSS